MAGMSFRTTFPHGWTGWMAAWVVTASAVVGVPHAWAAPFSGVMFEDAPSFRPDTLLPVYGQALGAPLSDTLAQRLSLDLIELYRSHGYLAPAPRLVRTHAEAGILVMEMREAHVARVRLDGREHVDAPGFWPLVQELRGTRPLSRAGFDDWLRRANSFGFAVQGSLTRMEADSAEYMASLNVAGRRWQGVVHVDNRGPSQVGGDIAQVSLNYRWPREAWGHLRLDVAAAVDHERLRYVGLSGGHRVRERGERVHWSYARSESTLPIPGTVRTVDYQRERAEVGLRVPLVRRLRQRAELSLAVRSYDLDQFLDDGRRLRRDRIRAAELGYDLAVAGAGGRRHSLEVAMSQGLKGLGASLSPPGAQADFTVLTGRYRYSQGLDTAWRVWTDVHLQASADRLPASERFFIGGRHLGGAFDPATLSGDQGLGVRLGIDRGLSVAGTPVTTFAYYDHGYVWSNDNARPADDAGSVGLGVRGAYRKLSWSLELGVPARAPETPTLLEDKPRAFFSLTQQF
jgi:hemolysin activation/secretion protein